MSTCAYDTGSMYGCTPLCSRPAEFIVVYRNGTSGPFAEPVCAQHLGPMRGRAYPGLISVETVIR